LPLHSHAARGNERKNDTNTVNDYIHASIACVQNADESLLQKIILMGLKKMEENA